MNVLIVEDELPAYNRLKKLVESIRPAFSVADPVTSISAALEWFANNKAPDVVFLDINLADGSAFNLLQEIDLVSPVIFTTAYDQFALDAFKTTSIDYLLKPIKEETLLQAILKLEHFQRLFAAETSALQTTEKTKRRFIIRFGDYLKSISVDDIAYFYSENKATFARCFDNRAYPIDQNLDALEAVLPHDLFFRLNRQLLTSLKAICEMRIHTKARVLVRLQPDAGSPHVVSSERSAAFKQWLGGE